MENKKLNSLERIKLVTDFATKYNIPFAKALKAYSESQNLVYDVYIRNGGGVKSDNSFLEGEAYKLTENYFGFLN